MVKWRLRNGFYAGRGSFAMPRCLYSTLFVLLLAGCASEDAAQVFTPYLDGDFQSWKGTGPATLTGQAFYKMPSGRVISCAGSMITLMPATSYNLEAEQSIGMGKSYPDNYNKAALKYAHKAMCDGAGHFSFQNLPTQNWIVMTHISWQVPSTYMFWKMSDKGGTLFQEVLLDAGDNKVVLSNSDFVDDDD
jgi:hypothetical protein